MRFTKVDSLHLIFASLLGIPSLLVFLCAVTAGPSRALAQVSSSAPTSPDISRSAAIIDAPKGSTTAVADTIPVGTAITTSNWGSYRQYMPDGMIALFEGKYFWKMPADVRMEIGPTVLHP